eukprot:590848-Prorocentrum_minimum.AAC.1
MFPPIGLKGTQDRGWSSSSALVEETYLNFVSRSKKSTLDPGYAARSLFWSQVLTVNSTVPVSRCGCHNLARTINKYIRVISLT